MKVVKDRKIGFVDLNSKIIIPLIYDEAKDISENKIIVKKDGFWGAVDLENTIIIPFEYNYLYPFSDGLAFFSKDKNTKPKQNGYINSSNQIIIQPDLEFCWYGNFKNGIAVAKKDGKYGYINKIGVFIIPNIYEEAFPFKEGIALVKENNRYSFINIEGKNIINQEFKQLYPVKNGFARFVE